MSLPGFTAGLSLNESCGYYVKTQKEAITRGGGVVMPQQLEIGWYSLDCGDCCKKGAYLGHVRCSLYFNTPILFGVSSQFLGFVQLPFNCRQLLRDCTQ